MAEYANFKRNDVRSALDALEDCTRLLDEDYRDLEEYRRTLATVKARLDASREALTGAVDQDGDSSNR